MTQRPGDPPRIDRVVLRITGMTEADARAVAAAAVERLARGPEPFAEGPAVGSATRVQAHIAALPGAAPTELATQAARVAWRGNRNASG